MRRILLFVLIAVALIYIAMPGNPTSSQVQAQADTETPTETATETSTATQTSTASPTNTSTATATPSATNTPTRPAVYLPAIRAPGNTPTLTGTATNTPSVTPTASATRTATSTPIPPVFVPNGDFEQGKVAWIEDGGFVAEQATLAHRGSWFALLGGSDAGAKDTITQRIYVPTERPYLTFWYDTSSTWFSCDNDKAYVWIDPAPDDGGFSGVIVDSYYEFCQSRRHDYRQAVVNLSGYAGQIVELKFEMDTVGGVSSFLSIDDVAFGVTGTSGSVTPVTATPGGPSAPSATTTATRTITPTRNPSACDPSYPTVCIPPPPPDLNCGDITYRNFTVLPPDPHHFDTDGDGIGCETR